jgi:hypothetical protein
MGHFLTHAPQQSEPSFDHLVGSREQCRWYVEVERFGGLEVDNQLDFRGLLDRQVGCFSPLRIRLV